MISARELVMRFLESRVFVGLERSVNLLYAKTAMLPDRRVSSAPKVELLIATNGNGNIGDQAMFESFLRNTDGDVVAIVRQLGDFSVPSDLASSVRLEPFGGYFSGRPRVGFRPTRRLVRLIRGASSVSIIGADILDGGYGPRESIARSFALEVSAILGVPSRVLGFSWNARPHPMAASYLLRASRSSALLARDPSSFARLEALGMQNVTLVADTVFALDVDQPVPEVDSWLKGRAGKKLFILNVSGLIRRNVDLTDEYRQIVDKVITAGYCVIVLPHVFREGDDDLDACKDFVSILPPSPDVQLMEKKLSPSEVSWLGSQAELVLTGRMHLAIMAFRRGAPAIVLSTQGKVSGLMSMFHLPELELKPDSRLATNFAELFGPTGSTIPVWRSTAAARLPEVIGRSRINFAPDAASTMPSK